MSQEEIQLKSSKGNYFITGEKITGWVGGHPYVIGAKHLQYNDSMYLGKKEIEKMEKEHGSMCAASGCTMKYAEHEEITAYKIFCKKAMYQKSKHNYWHEDSGRKLTKELHEFILKAKEELEMSDKDNFACVDADNPSKGAREFP